MKQYVFYDKKTGAIRHVHQVVTAEGRAVEVDNKQLASFVERMVDLKAVGSLYADVKAMSSRAAVQHVDTKRRRFVSKRLTAREQERIRRREE
jgi:uncharacterized protein YggL (DUF469 family)